MFLFWILYSLRVEHNEYWKVYSKFSHYLKKTEVHLLESDHRGRAGRIMPEVYNQACAYTRSSRTKTGMLASNLLGITW